MIAGGVSITGELDAGSGEMLERLSQFQGTDLDEQWFGGFAGVPPMRQATLRIRVDQCNRANAGILRRHRYMAGQHGLSRSAFFAMIKPECALVRSLSVTRAVSSRSSISSAALA